jgi:hypothetical protein
VLSTVIGWLVSGIVGNAAYDALRRFVMPRKSAHKKR